MNDLISVVVTIYNLEGYLCKCVNSVRNQTYQNLDIILVDDGSVDNSPELCNQLRLDDNRISVIHKNNEGEVAARRSGVEQARGKYTLFVDGDDWIEPDMVYELYRSAVEHNADIVTSGCYRQSEDIYTEVFDGVAEGVYDTEKNGEEIFGNLIYVGLSERNGITPMLINKLIRTCLAREVHAGLSNQIYYGGDSAAMFACFSRARTIVITHNIYYHYILHAGSVTSSTNPYYLRSVNELYLFLKGEFQKSKYQKVLIQQLDIYIAKQVFLGLSYYMGLGKPVAIPYYDFDKNVMEKGARIILYGAGKVGRAFYSQICTEKCYQVVEWVDKNYLALRKQGLNVSSIETIGQVEYDYILLALMEQDKADMARKILIKNYQIDADKIIWTQPISMVDKYKLIEREE